MVYSLVCCTWTAHMWSWASTLRYHPKLWSDVTSVSCWKFKLSVPWFRTIGFNTIFGMYNIWSKWYGPYIMIIWPILYGKIEVSTYSGGLRLFESGWSPSGIKWLSTSVLIFVPSKLKNLLLFFYWIQVKQSFVLAPQIIDLLLILIDTIPGLILRLKMNEHEHLCFFILGESPSVTLLVLRNQRKSSKM